jgi:Uncharacterized protein conserved in bacteria (DUF2325)
MDNREVRVRVSLVGGIGRLERHYVEEARKLGIELRVFNRNEVDLSLKIRNMAAVVLITGKISHQARRRVMDTARLNAIPVYQRKSCGVCTLRDCLSCLAQG